MDGEAMAAEARRLRVEEQLSVRQIQQRRDARRTAAQAAAAAAVGPLSGRDLLILGAAIYWCEGAKAKPWNPDEKIQFTNSDPMLVELFLRFLECQGRDRAALTYRVSIHESADHEGAVDWWVERLGIPRERFMQTTLKRHVPRTNRRNTGADYRGCLVVNVPKGRELYWRVEGVMRGCQAGRTDSAGGS